VITLAIEKHLHFLSWLFWRASYPRLHVGPRRKISDFSFCRSRFTLILWCINQWWQVSRITKHLHKQICNKQDLLCYVSCSMLPRQTQGDKHVACLAVQQYFSETKIWSRRTVKVSLQGILHYPVWRNQNYTTKSWRNVSFSEGEPEIPIFAKSGRKSLKWELCHTFSSCTWSCHYKWYADDRHKTEECSWG